MNNSQKAITIDFWNTLVDSKSNGKNRVIVRMKALMTTLKVYRNDLTQKELALALHHASEEYNRIWFSEVRTLTTGELLECMFRYLGVRPNEQETANLVRVFHESMFAGPPNLAVGVEKIVPKLASRYPLAIISDTMFSPGVIIREYLKLKGIYAYFRGFVFSDETGFSKPNVGAFRKALESTGGQPAASYHIGDIQRTDVVGARAAGMKSILYTGVSDQYKNESDADFIVDSWEKIGGLLLD